MIGLEQIWVTSCILVFYDNAIKDRLFELVGFVLAPVCRT